MNNITGLKEKIYAGQYDEVLLDIYVDEACLPYQKQRYTGAIENYKRLFGMGKVSVYSAPGRTEIGGNHTDHQRGEVLTAALNVDAIAVVGIAEEPVVKIVSGDSPMILVLLDDLEADESETGTTTSLIKGVLSELKSNGYAVGGFNAYITSDVLIGSGISSSAAFETLIGAIVSGLYNDMQIPAEKIAKVGQYAENVYFGKPCGLMDQMASAVGNLVYIDFADVNSPKIEKIDCEFTKFGYSLCITDTKSSHADCTPEYAAIPAEMKSVAEVFGKEVLSEVVKEDLFANIDKVRKVTGDRAVLRAMHFMMENERVGMEVSALKEGEFEEFLKLVKASGNSSYKYLQNIYINSDVGHQNVSLALAMSEAVLGENGVCRVHGGGFAGTIQAFVKDEAVEEYRKTMDDIFGENACNVYRVRKFGGIKVF